MTHANLNFIEHAYRVLDIEKEAIDNLYQYLNKDFEIACTLLMACKGKVIVTGMGKSGHIGNKIAATLASTGTASFYVHPGEASHGDLGMITSKDVVIAISNSGETGEVNMLLPVLKRLGCKIIAITGKPESTLAKAGDAHICVAVKTEACPLGLAPTASTTATLVMGDAIAVALLKAKGFTEDQFALSHPGGSLGKRLLLRVRDIMHTGDELPVVSCQDIISDVLLTISQKRLGFTAVVNKDGSLAGIFTDGDLRRILDQRVDIHNTEITEVITKNCITTKADMLAAEALRIMQENKISGLIVSENDKPIGAFNMHDLLRAGVV